MKNKLRAVMRSLIHPFCHHLWKEVWWSPYMNYGLVKTWCYVCVKCHKSTHSQVPWYGIEHLQRHSQTH